MVRFSLVCLVGLVASGPAWPASWADAMFDELSKDFGSVPRGPTLTHSFRVTNNTGSPVQLGNIRLSCSRCTRAHVLKHHLAPGEHTLIETQMDTSLFVGSKSVTIYVEIVKPRVEEVRLWVQANSREDISVSPDTLAMGRIQRGGNGEAKVTLTLSGNGQSQVREVTSESNYILPEVKEVSRTANEVVYQLTARLRTDAPVGRWFSDVWLTTDNPSVPKVRVPLTVEIASLLSVSPATVQLGQVKMGGEAERKIIVRGVKPFAITEIKGGDGQLEVTAARTEKKPVHVLTVKVKPTELGERKWNLNIQTDLVGESSIELPAQAEVVPAN